MSWESLDAHVHGSSFYKDNRELLQKQNDSNLNVTSVKILIRENTNQ